VELHYFLRAKTGEVQHFKDARRYVGSHFLQRKVHSARKTHERSRIIVEDTGLGIERSDKVVVVQVISRPRKKKKKVAFYQSLCEELERKCGIASSDIMVSIVENSDEDWSFGIGRAQFLEGDL
jgi:hypothetical protein